MNRFNGLTFSRQGLQVIVLVLTPLLFLGLLLCIFSLFPSILNTDWFYMVFAMVFLCLGGWLTLKLHNEYARVPCNIELNGDALIINIEKRNIFYPYKQKVFSLVDIKNASCSLDTRLNKVFINITMRKTKTTYALQYTDDRGDNPNPEVWKQLEAMLTDYNTNSNSEYITKVGFFESGFMLVLLFVSGGFIIAFSIAMIMDSQYRDTERVFKFSTFSVIFVGLLSSYLYNKKRNNKP